MLLTVLGWLKILLRLLLQLFTVTTYSTCRDFFCVDNALSCCCSPWMRDVSFFATSVLLTLTACQLYQVVPIGSLQPGQSRAEESSDLFLDHLFLKAELQLREALRSPSASFSSSFSDSLGVQLVKGLFLSGLSSPPPSELSGSTRHDSVMRQLLDHFQDRDSLRVQQTALAPVKHRAGSGAVQGLLQGELCCASSALPL